MPQRFILVLMKLLWDVLPCGIFGDSEREEEYVVSVVSGQSSPYWK